MIQSRGVVMPEAPALFKNIYRRSNIGVVQRCIQVPQGGTGSSVTAGKHKREIPAASQRAMPPASLSYFHSHSHTGPWTLDPARPETEVQTKLDLRVGGERTHLGPGEERRQPFRHKKHLPCPPQELTFAQQLLLSFIWGLKMLL